MSLSFARDSVAKSSGRLTGILIANSMNFPERLFDRRQI